MSAAYDNEFAHAVYRAVHGLKQSIRKAKVNGARLAVILRSNSELDAHGVEHFAQGVTGTLPKRYNGKQLSGESDFAQAVRDAFEGSRAKEGKSRKTEGKDLAVILRSDRPPLGVGERELLAQMVTRTGPTFWYDGKEVAQEILSGAPPKGAGHPHVIATVRLLRRFRKHLWKAKKFAQPVSKEEQIMLNKTRDEMRDLREWIKLDDIDIETAIRRGRPSAEMEELKENHEKRLSELEVRTPRIQSAEALVVKNMGRTKKTIKEYERVTIEYEKVIATVKSPKS